MPRSSACRRSDWWRRNRSRPRPATCSPWTASRAGSSSTASHAPPRCASRATMRCAAASSISIAPGMAEPVRLDFFGDTLETDPQLRSGDAAHHRPAARARPGAGRRVPAHHRDHPALPPRLCRGLRRADARRPALRGGERGPPPSRHGALAAAVPRAARHACSTTCPARRSCSSRSPRTPRASASTRSRTITSARRQALAPARLGPALPAAAARPALSRRSRMAARGSMPARWRGSRRSPCRTGRGRRSISARSRAQFRRRAQRARPQCVRGGDRARHWRCRPRASASSSRCGARARASA